MTISMIFLLLGGLGMFLYGMRMMSDGLENIAGDKMRQTLEVLTTNRFAAVGVGAGVTALIQSSSATTVMVVGFVNAGLMSLLQATGVIMGANIGTTITAQLIAFKLSDIAPFILFVGMFMTVFIKKRNLARIGEIVLGFGILFVGLDLMSRSMEPLRSHAGFQSLLTSFSNPLLGILIGAIFTAVIQSSSASVGVLQALAATGLIGLDGAIFVILGQNIGTCITAILASIGASTNSKRTAGIHLVFNILGTLIYLPILLLFPSIVTWIESLSIGDVSRQIANYHTLFNITITIVLFPFAKQMVKLITKIVKDKQGDDHVEKKLIYLDERIAQTPSIALTQTLKEIDRMGEIVFDNLKNSTEALFEYDEQKVDKVFEVEKTIDYLTNEITHYLIEFKGLQLSKSDLRVMGSLHHVVIDLERIGDLAENIANNANTRSDKKVPLSSEGLEELKTMSERATQALRLSLDALRKRDVNRLPEVASLEQQIDDMKIDYTNNHINRLQDKYCDPSAGVIFTNLVAIFERIADHANNIASSLVVK